MELSETFVDSIEKQLKELMPDQDGYECLDWARKISEGLNDDFLAAVDSLADDKADAKLEDACQEAFEDGAREDRDIADKEIAEAYEKGYQACKDELAKETPP